MFHWSIFCKDTEYFLLGKKMCIFIQKGGNILLYHWHQSISSVSVERYSKGGVVGSGIKALNFHISSRSSIKLFENNSVRGTKPPQSGGFLFFDTRNTNIVIYNLFVLFERFVFLINQKSILSDTDVMMSCFFTPSGTREWYS